MQHTLVIKERKYNFFIAIWHFGTTKKFFFQKKRLIQKKSINLRDFFEKYLSGVQ